MFKPAFRILILTGIILISGLIISCRNGKIPGKTFSEINHFEDDKKANWTTIFPEYISDMQFNSPPTSYKMTEKMEWGPAFSLPLKEIVVNKSDRLEISVNIYSEDSIPPEVILISSLNSGQQEVYKNSANLLEFHYKSGWNRLTLTENLTAFPPGTEDLVFTTQVWNKGHRKIFIDDYEIAIRTGNSAAFH